MSFQERSLDEREAASIVAGLGAAPSVASAAAGTKRSHDDTDRPDTAASSKPAKKKAAKAAGRGKAAAAKKRKEPPMDATGLVFKQAELRPPPYFYYTDHSLERDDDPLIPMTAAGSVPTFPAKMHAILTNPELADVVGWAPHGRSWRILKPRDFEIRILPKYFEHSKFSSFVRQANGWGFRRMSQGYDKNAYYHEYFLRSMPHLCKKMRRPKVSEKKAVDPEMEPDFDAISLQFPVPDEPPTRELLVLQKVIEMGPKARMPVMWDTGTPPPASPVGLPAVPSADNLAEVGKLPALNHSASYGDLKPAARPDPPSQAAPPPAAQTVAAPATTNENGGMGMGNMMQSNVQQQYHENTLLSHSAPAPVQTSVPTLPYAAAAAVQPSVAPAVAPEVPSSTLASDSNFAAGFMAATAYHSNQMRHLLTNAFVAGMPIPDNNSVVMPAAAAAAPTQMVMHAPPTAAVMPAPSVAATATAANLGNAFELLQSAGMGQIVNQNNFAPQGNPNVAAFALQPRAAPAAAAAGYASQPNTADMAHAMQRLQQFQAYQAARGDTSHLSYPPRNP